MRVIVSGAALILTACAGEPAPWDGPTQFQQREFLKACRGMPDRKISCVCLESQATAKLDEGAYLYVTGIMAEDNFLTNRGRAMTAMGMVGLVKTIPKLTDACE